ncbi:MAG: AbrB/MazE/SpoVT family DNA-binding domain-containing protein [Acidobacteria bacterium]|nr:AbrB/MazE/SpoVT family DNA-binding domain-containing protein [Acidobacteriota bacterium]
MKNEPGCCSVEAVVSIDERGQMVLPKELREKAGIKAGEKLALTSFYKNGEICCITITKAQDLAEQVKSNLGDTLKDLTR